MADPRFYDNRGPFRLAELCAGSNLRIPEGADADARIFDVAGVAQAGPSHLSFWHGRGRAGLPPTKAGWCLVGDKVPPNAGPGLPLFLSCPSVSRTFAGIAGLFYPEHELGVRAQDALIHPGARLGQGVGLAPGVVIGPGVDIGAGTRIGANSVIGRGVSIGRSCEIGPHVSIGFAYLGDGVVVQAGAVIGGSGFGFSSGADGHVKIPQLGRVIIQDKVEVGANSTIDRGALTDTVIGEGTKIDNLVQIGHNSMTGRHCIMVGKSGIAGSVTLGDFVIVGGLAGIADHVHVGDYARLAGHSGVTRDLLGGRDYGGYPAREIKQWHREMAILARLAKKDARAADE